MVPMQSRLLRTGDCVGVRGIHCGGGFRIDFRMSRRVVSCYTIGLILRPVLRGTLGCKVERLSSFKRVMIKNRGIKRSVVVAMSSGKVNVPRGRVPFLLAGASEIRGGNSKIKLIGMGGEVGVLFKRHCNLRVRDRLSRKAIIAVGVPTVICSRRGELRFRRRRVT